jgi:hypothetical protein
MTALREQSFAVKPRRHARHCADAFAGIRLA